MVGLGFVQKKSEGQNGTKEMEKGEEKKKSQMVHFKNDKGFIT